MAENEIPEKVKNFIYLYLDSVELLEILLLFHKNDKKSWSASSLAAELRSNANSAQKRILFLKTLGVLSDNPAVNGEYFYQPSYPELHETVTELAQAYVVQRHKIFELIFSPMKKARDFADAFRRGTGNNDGRDDG